MTDIEIQLTELLNNEVNNIEIASIIEKNDHVKLAKFIGRKLCDFTENDDKYIDMFWDAAFNKSWLYLSDEIIINWMGYKKSKSSISDFVREMKSKYVREIDYKEVTKDFELIVLYYNSHSGLNRDGNRKKYYIITGETLKKMLLRAGTKQGDITCDYFIKIEKLANITSRAVFTFLNNIKDKQLAEKNAQLNRLHNINEELLTYKKLSEKNESIYLVSTLNYIKQGLIKVGRTKNIKNRSSGHNVTHPVGDKIKVLYEFKVNDSVLVESIVHKKLVGLRPDKNSEFFMCPYDLLYNIVNMITNNDDEENAAVNIIIDSVFKLKQKEFKYLDWTSGLDMSIFEENIKLVENTTDADGNNIEINRAEFNVTTATKQQKDAFIRDCILSYQKNILIPQKLSVMSWMAFQSYFILKLNIAKSQFKALEWRDEFKNVADKEKIKYQIKKM
jgi:hypothetical protein